LKLRLEVLLLMLVVLLLLQQGVILLVSFLHCWRSGPIVRVERLGRGGGRGRQHTRRRGGRHDALFVA